MIVKEERGDIFESTCQTITCPINVVGAMGKGLAAEFRDRIPGLYAFYQRHYPARTANPERRANDIQLFRISDDRQVLLFPTKVHYRDRRCREQIETNLEKLAKEYQLYKITSLAIPALGCGEGWLDYEKDIRPLVYRYLSPIPLPVEVAFW